MLLSALLLLAMTQDSETETAPRAEPPPEAGLEELAAAAAVIGLEFTEEELELMRDGVAQNRRALERLRARTLDDAVPPALGFDPLAFLPGWETRASLGFEPEPLTLPEPPARPPSAPATWCPAPIGPPDWRPGGLG